jgi:hypothetical protein
MLQRKDRKKKKNKSSNNRNETAWNITRNPPKVIVSWLERDNKTIQSKDVADVLMSIFLTL